jgi:hypothetical protein
MLRHWKESNLHKEVPGGGARLAGGEGEPDTGE